MRRCRVMTARRIWFAVVLSACGGSQQPPPSAARAQAKPPPPPPSAPTQGLATNAQLNGMFVNTGCGQMTGTPETVALFQKACDAHDGQGCSELAGRYLCGKGVAQDYAKSTVLSEQGCDYGYIQSCNNVAMMVAYPQAKLDPSIAFKYADKGCSAGDPAACNGVGLMYLQGIGTAADPVKAGRLFDDLCKKNNAMACANLAMQAYLGIGMPRDVKHAAELADSACKQGMPSACNTLGGILIEEGGDDNMHRAEVLFTTICDQADGNAACDNLGQLYAHGITAKEPPNKDRAAAMFKKACDAGFAKSCTHLAELMSGQ